MVLDLQLDIAQVDYEIAIVVSRFNLSVTEQLLQGAYGRLEELQETTDNVTVVWVPGAVEIPLAAQRLVQTDRFSAVIALGAVIRGETSHYDYVCQQVSSGCQQVALASGVPVVFGVLTTETTEQALDRVGGNHGHKGVDAADTAITMLNLLRRIEEM